MSHLSYATYGKDKVRVFRVVRNSDGTHDVAEYIVCALLEGDVAEAWTKSDNTNIVATDSIKNTIYIKAKLSPHILQPESFALELGIHFVTKYAHIHKAHVDITQLKWSRIPVKGKPHRHSFVRNGSDERFTSVSVDASKGSSNISAKVASGIKNLLVLKTTESSFENFYRDEYRTLPDVSDRIFSTSVDCSYTYIFPSSSLSIPSLNTLGIKFDNIFKSVETTTLEVFAEHNSASVQATLYIMAGKILEDNKDVGEVTYKLPNKHYFAVDMNYFGGIKNTSPTDAEVFMPVDSPSGLIIATVSRGLGKL